MRCHFSARLATAGLVLTLISLQAVVAQTRNDRQDEPERYEQARMLLVENRFKETIELLSPPTPDSLHTSEYYLLGLAYQAQQDFEPALLALLRADSMDAAVRSARGRCYEELGRPDEAAENYRIAWRLDPANRSAAMALGRLLADNGRWDEARDVYVDLVRSDSISAFLQAQLGTVYRALRLTDDAIVAYEASHGLAPSNVRVALQLSLLYVSTSDFTSARRVVDRAMEVHPNNTQLLERSGEIALKNEEFLLAQQAFEKALALGDSSAFTLRGLGISHYMQQRAALADSFLTRSWLADSTDGVTAVYLGMANINLSNYDRAVYYLKSADPLLGSRLVADIHTHLAVVYEQTGHETEAIREYEAVHTIAPRRVEILLQMARVFEKLDRRQDAIRCYREFMAMTDSAGPGKLHDFVMERIKKLQARQ